MKIIVTEEDIHDGEKDTIEKCPINLAARRAFPGRWIEVYPTYLLVEPWSWHNEEDTKTRVYNLPCRAQRFISGKFNKPFEFELGKCKEFGE